LLPLLLFIFLLIITGASLLSKENSGTSKKNRVFLF